MKKPPESLAASNRPEAAVRGGAAPSDAARALPFDAPRLPPLLGGLPLMVRRSLRQHALSTSVTVLAVALAGGLVMSVFAIQKQTLDAFTGGNFGFDGVVGARGSPLQLVLNAVFHLETSPGNIPWSLYTELKGRRYVETAVPIALGDNYHGYRIVGTTEEMFTKLEYQVGRRYTVAPPGRFFNPELREAVVGSTVAAKARLGVGSVFNPYHGLDFNPEARHADEYVVVGVLAPTNTPADRVIWIPIEGVYRMSDHELRGSGQVYVPSPAQDIPDEHKEVSAVLVKLRNFQAGMRLDREINREGKVATFAWPIANVMSDLFDKLGWVNRVLELVAYLVIVVAAFSILAAMYNTINERRREFAILRALGARRRTVLSAILLESATISALGALLGFVVYAAIVSAAAAVVRAQTGVVLEALAWHPILWIAPVGMILVGLLAGLIPAWKAYGTDVATNLSPAT